jgi:ADP-heptose:LPS heptosyltransferase
MILLHLKSKELRNGKENPKNYPYIDELKELLNDDIIEITKPIPLKESIELIKKAKNIICIDSYLQHLCWSVGKKAIVLWGQGNPEIFGHKENINLLKSKDNLREFQFRFWEQSDYKKDVFIKPKKVIKYLE